MTSFGRGSFARGGGSAGGRGGFSQSNADDNNQENSGFASTRGGRGGFATGAPTGDNQDAPAFGSTRGGRGTFGAGGRGGFGNEDNQDAPAFGSSRGGRGTFGSARGGGVGNGENQDAPAFGPSRGGNFGGGRGRGASSFGDNQNGSSDFNVSRGGRGGSFGRGGFNSSNTAGDDNQEGASSTFGSNRGNFGGRGRGTFAQNSEGGDNAGFGGRGGRGRGFSNDNQDGSSRGGNFGGRGAFAQNSEGGDNAGFGGRGGRGRGFGNENQDGSSRGGNFGGGRGRGASTFGDNQNGSSDFSTSRGRGAFGRGAFGSSNTAGDDNQEGASTFASNRGSFGGRGRGDFGQNSEGGENAGFGGRGGRGRGYGNDNQDGSSRGGNFGGGRGAFNQNFGGDNQENNGFSGRGGTRGRGAFGGQSNQDGQSGDNQENSSRGGFGGRGRGAFQSGENQDNGGFASGRGGRGAGFSSNRGNFGNNEGNQGRGGFENNQDAEGGNQERAPRPPRTDGETPEGGERAPINFIPEARKIDDLYAEDQSAANDYADCADKDEAVTVKNFGGNMVRLQNWEEAEFESQLLTNVKDRAKYIRPREIQSATIPFVLDHFDIKAQAETGSGKTAAFVLPIIDACMKAKKSTGDDRFESELCCPYAIVIGPTRELVMQVYEQAVKFAAGTDISVAKAYGQYNIGRNHSEIRAGCDILVATPGRLKQFVTSSEVNVKNLYVLVLDEADRLLDQNFSVDIMEIVNTPGFPDKTKRQTLLFSATFPEGVEYVASQLLKPDAIFITNERNNPNKRIKQDFILCERPNKLVKLAEILKAEAEKAGGADKIRRTLVFVNTKRWSDMVALYLCQQDIPSTSINGDRGQDLRERALRDFRNHKVAVLCATDVCARGIDVKQLDHVINLEVPSDAITYVHRIGRTGRIAQGYATTFIEGGEPLLGEIAEMMKQNGEEVPETLKSALDGNVGQGAGAPSSSFTPQLASANSVPVNSAAPAAAASNTDDW